MFYEVFQCFHAVGHGTFMTGMIHTHGREFSWVYDCGSRRSSAINVALDAAKSYCSDPIGILALSHFDDDHVNGLEALLTQRRVNYLVLPFSEWQQRVRDVVIGGLKGVSASTALLQLSPMSWLQSKQLASKVGTLLLVRGGASGQDGAQDPMPLPIDGSPTALDGDSRHQESSEQRDLRLITTASAAAPRVQVMQHGTPVHPVGFPMEFMFYNAELSGADLGILKKGEAGELIAKKSELPLQEVRDEIEGEISSLRLDQPISHWPPDWRAKLKKCYEKHFGSTGSAKNNISLCMYVAPISARQFCPYDCRQFCPYDCRHFCCVNAIVPCKKDRPAMLCTGDLRLDSNVIAAMKVHFGNQRWGRIGLTQVPHHGSHHSWVAGNAKLLEQSAFVHCAPGKGAHPHNNVVADLAGHTVFTADYQNSVEWAYCFLAP